MSGSFRYVRSQSRGVYSVFRGDLHLGYVRHISHEIYGRTKPAGWRAFHGAIESAMILTREDAASWLWTTRIE